MQVPSRTGAQDSRPASREGASPAAGHRARAGPCSRERAARAASSNPVAPSRLHVGGRPAPVRDSSTAALAAPDVPGLRSRPFLPSGLEEAASGRWLGTCRDPLGSLGSGPRMSAFWLQRWAARIGPGVSAPGDAGVGEGWHGHASGDRMPPGRWQAELSSGHSEGFSPCLGGPGF